jgi:multimeric flavodoxin WrbA
VARLLIIHHSPSPTVRRLTEAVLEGARDDEIEGVEVVALDALDFATGSADHTNVLAADGYILITSANFGYMSGAMKHFFDSTFQQIGGALDSTGGAAQSPTPTATRPYGLLVHGKYDTVGAVRSVQAIVKALGWQQAASNVEILGDLCPDALSQATELGATVAAHLM